MPAWNNTGFSKTTITHLKVAIKNTILEFQLAGYKPRTDDYSAGRPLIVGFLSSPTGIGQGARLIMHGLQEAGIVPAIHDITPALQPSRSTVALPEGESDDGNGPIILHANPPEVLAALNIIGKDRLAGRRLIGYWAWELPRPPPSWRRALKWFDEIWTPSQFTADAIKQISDIPVTSVGYPMIIAEPPDEDIQHWRTALNLAGKFSVLAAYDPHSSVARKNPEAAIHAFLEAFSTEPDVRLILKTFTDADLTALHRKIEHDDRIVLVSEFLSTDRMNALIQSVDCTLNLHRSEGYGLLPAQSTALGVPSIVTGWSSVEDFLACPGMLPVGYDLVPVNDPQNQYPSACGPWAEPKLDQAAALLRELKQLGQEAKAGKTARSRQYWADEHSPEAWLARMPQSTRVLLQGR